MVFYGLLGISYEDASHAVKVIATVTFVFLLTINYRLHIPVVDAYCRFSDELDQ